MDDNHSVAVFSFNEDTKELEPVGSAKGSQKPIIG